MHVLAMFRAQLGDEARHGDERRTDHSARASARKTASKRVASRLPNHGVCLLFTPTRPSYLARWRHLSLRTCLSRRAPHHPTLRRTCHLLCPDRTPPLHLAPHPEGSPGMACVFLHPVPQRCVCPRGVLHFWIFRHSSRSSRSSPSESLKVPQAVPQPCPQRPFYPLYFFSQSPSESLKVPQTVPQRPFYPLYFFRTGQPARTKVSARDMAYM